MRFLLLANPRSYILKIGVIGAGGWGTALSNVLVHNDIEVVLWSFEHEVAEEINNSHKNTTYLPDVELDSRIYATSKHEELYDADCFLISTPTQFIRSVLIEDKFPINDKLIINVAKGIEKNSLMRISELIFDVAHIDLDNYVVLTGPSHAEEVVRKMPTAVVAASSEMKNAQMVQKLFSNPYFRVYTSEDVTGAEIGAALKNVIALAAGVVDGLGLGDNTKAALITRGLAEISRLGIALGANPQTFSGLSGLGDLIVTCSSKHSRNRFVGEQLGKGVAFSEIMKSMKMVAEGVETTKSSYQLAKKHNVELPIAEQMYKVLFEGYQPHELIDDLMTRKYKREWWW